MELLSKSAQAILDDELESYKKKLLDRASLYVDHDGELLIREKQIKAAIRDYDSPELGEIKSPYNKRIDKHLFVFMWAMFFFLFVFLFFCVIYLEKGTYENGVAIIGVIVSSISLILTFWMMTINRKKKGNKSDNIVAYLREWDEFESFLRYSYKGPNKAGNVAFTDLIGYYLDNFSDDKDVDERKIITLLRMRNSLVHRGIKDVNEETIIRQTDELQDLIKRMKK